MGVICIPVTQVFITKVLATLQLPQDMRNHLIRLFLNSRAMERNHTRRQHGIIIISHRKDTKMLICYKIILSECGKRRMSLTDLEVPKDENREKYYIK